MLTEQTRDFEAGRHDQVLAMHRRYVRSTGALMVVAVPILWIVMPFLIGIYGASFRAHATDAARLVLVAAALQLVWGWTKSFPVSIGRPELRVWVQAIETAVFIPLLLIFASRWGATGAAGAMLVATVVFCAIWSILLRRIKAGWATARSRSREGPRRLGDLAARCRRPRLACTGGGGVPAGAGTRGCRGDHGRRARPRARPTRCTGSAGRCRRVCATSRPFACCARSRARVGRRLHDRACSAAPRSARCSLGRRS